MTDWNALFESYTKNGCTIELMRQWLISEGKVRGFGPEVVETVLDQLFIDLANGTDFMTPCPCGCGGTNVHTHINHHALKQCLELSKIYEETVTKVRENALNRKIEAFARGIPGIETHNDLDGLYDLLDAIYSQLNGQAERDKAEAQRLRYYRAVSIWRKPLGRIWKENIWRKK